MRSIRGSLLVVAGVLVGCSDGHSRPPAAPGSADVGAPADVGLSSPLLPLDELAPKFARMLCEQLFACCSAAERPFADLTTCQREVAAQWDEQAAPVRAGKQVYEGR